MASKQEVKLARVQGLREAVRLFTTYRMQGIGEPKALQDILDHASLLEDLV